MSNDTRKDARSRVWTFIVYPESAPSNWRELLSERHLSFAVSPLHDSDLTATGELKKPHWHVVVKFSSKKSRSQVTELTDLCNAPGGQTVSDTRGMIRYLAHLDNPEKAQYDPADIETYGGWDITEYILSGSRYQILNAILEWCADTGTVEFADLIDYARRERPADWFPLLCDSGTIMLNAYLKSARYRGLSKSTPGNIDPKTGEVIDG